MRISCTGFIAFLGLALLAVSANAQETDNGITANYNKSHGLVLQQPTPKPAPYCINYGVAYTWGDNASNVHCHGDAAGGICTDGSSFWSEPNPCNSSHDP